MTRAEKTNRRAAIMRNLHQLGCKRSEIAEGFGVSLIQVDRLMARGMVRKANPCPRHITVVAACRTCRRVPQAEGGMTVDGRGHAERS